MPLVNESTIINSELIFLIKIVWSLMRSPMAKYLMPICLLRLPLLLFLAIKTATESSHYIFSGLKIESPIFNPEMKLFIHTPCDVALKQDMNSASIVEVVIKVYFALFQEKAPSANKKM